MDQREVGGEGPALHVGRALAVRRDGLARVVAVAAQVGATQDALVATAAQNQFGQKPLRVVVGTLVRRALTTGDLD